MPFTFEDEVYYTIEETAERLQIKRQTVYNKTKKGELIPYEINKKTYYKQSDIENILMPKPIGKKTLHTRIISIANQKGGVGKTTSSIHISSGLAKMGYKTLVIDNDSQQNLTSIFLDLNSLSSKDTLFAIYEHSRDVTDLIHTTNYMNLDIIPASIRLAECTGLLLGKSIEGYFYLNEALQNLKNYDYIIIDCPPSLDILTVNALTASSEVVLPVQSDLFSLEGIISLKSTIEQTCKYTNNSLKVSGIFFTHFEKARIVTQTYAKDFEDIFPVFKTRISRSADIQKAQALRKSIFDYNVKCKSAKEYETLIEEIINVGND